MRRRGAEQHRPRWRFDSQGEATYRNPRRKLRDSIAQLR